MRGENEINLTKQENLRKLKISFQVEGIFIDHSCQPFWKAAITGKWVIMGEFEVQDIFGGS